MSLLDQYTEVARYFSEEHRGLIVITQEGDILRLRLGDEDWKVFSRKKADIPTEEWLNRKKNQINQMPAWARETRELPSVEDMTEWLTDGQCETPSGDEVEPDGHGPDGAPSWLLALGLI